MALTHCVDFKQLRQNYKELILIAVTAVAALLATLVGQKVLPGL